MRTSQSLTAPDGSQLSSGHSHGTRRLCWTIRYPSAQILPMNASEAYQQLTASVRETSLLDSIASFMSWDEHTYMPARGTAHRANQQSLVARMSHQQFTSPRIGELLGAVEGSDLVANSHSDAG